MNKKNLSKEKANDYVYKISWKGLLSLREALDGEIQRRCYQAGFYNEDKHSVVMPDGKRYEPQMVEVEQITLKIENLRVGQDLYTSFFLTELTEEEQHKAVKDGYITIDKHRWDNY